MLVVVSIGRVNAVKLMSNSIPLKLQIEPEDHIFDSNEWAADLKLLQRLRRQAKQWN